MLAVSLEPMSLVTLRLCVRCAMVMMLETTNVHGALKRDTSPMRELSGNTHSYSLHSYTTMVTGLQNCVCSHNSRERDSRFGSFVALFNSTHST